MVFYATIVVDHTQLQVFISIPEHVKHLAVLFNKEFYM